MRTPRKCTKHTVDAMKMHYAKLNCKWKKRKEESRPKLDVLRCIFIWFSHCSRKKKTKFHAKIMFCALYWHWRAHDGEKTKKNCLSLKKREEKWLDSFGMTAKNRHCVNESRQKGCSIHLKRGKKSFLIFCSFFFNLKNDLIYCRDNELSFGTFFFFSSIFFYCPLLRSQRWRCQYALHSFLFHPLFLNGHAVISFSRSQTNCDYI